MRSRLERSTRHAVLGALTGVIAALAAASPSGAARADDILLKNGNRLEGTATRAGSEVVIDLGKGTVRIPADDVASITKAPTRLDLYRERLAKAEPKDEAAHIALADWCRERKLPDLEKKHLDAVLALDPDHEDVRARLGFFRHQGAWLRKDEYMKARGFTKVDGEWLSAQEIEERKARALAAQAMKEHEKTIRNAIVKMQSPLRKPRSEGRLALIEYAERLGDSRLAHFAIQVAAYYNDQWRVIRDEHARASVRTDVRATLATLKRPIPTIQTSLGASSAPVTIQLPELSIVSVNTTVSIPARIELDEDE